mgnify:CR=1 FL=1
MAGVHRCLPARCNARLHLMSIAIAVAAFEALPETDQERCDDALERGSYLEASFYCPAGTWLSSLFGSGDEDDDEDDEENEQ